MFMSCMFYCLCVYHNLNEISFPAFFSFSVLTEDIVKIKADHYFYENVLMNTRNCDKSFKSDLKLYTCKNCMFIVKYSNKIWTCK